MTGTNDKIRAVFLAALMVLSVFAGTVAFAGSASAGSITGQAPEYEGNAVHYVNESGDGTPVIEVPFSEDINTSSLTPSNFTLLDDGDNITDYTTANITQDEGRVIIDINQSKPVSSNDLEIDLSSQIEDSTGDNLDNPGEKTVVFAGQTLEFEADGDGGGVDVQNNSPNVTAYQGVTIAINSSKSIENVPVTVEDEDDDVNYFQEGSTGVNSTVYTLDTENRELGTYKVFVNNSDDQDNRAYINLRDLQLDISVDDLNVTDDDTIETTVSAVAGGRDVEVQLLDSSGDDLNTTEATLDGQGEVDVDFDTASADDGDALDAGTYTVEVTDDATGVVVESSEITVSQADDESASFTENTIADERGDILEVTVEMTQTSEATLTFGSEDDGVVANATLEDDDGDDQVTVFINTYRFNQSAANNEDVFNLDSDSDDNILHQDISEQTEDLVDAGDYDLEVQAGDLGAGNGVENSDDVATVTLSERSTETLRMWTGSKEEINSFSDLEDVTEAVQDGTLTQSSEIAVGDFAVHQVEASGFEGALDARENEQVTSDFFGLITNGPLNLTIEEADPGANQDAAPLKLDSSNVTVIADGPNDTYYVAVDTDDVNFDSPRAGESLPADDDTELETNFTVLQDDAGFDFTPDDQFEDDENSETFVTFTAAEPDLDINEPYDVAAASGQTVSGTTNIAPGTEIDVRIRSDDGVTPSFLKTATPVIQSDGTWNATFDFSEQNVGDTYEIVVQDARLSSDQTEDGEVVEAVETATATPEPGTDTPEPDTATPEPDTATPEPDTATPEPDTATEEPATETPTSTPGFGVVVALTALIAAALLAIRRD